MTVKNGVAMYGDTGSHILLSNSGLSLTSDIGPDAVLAGTGAIDSSQGFNSGSAGSVSFSNIDPGGLLKYAGQISFDVTTYAVACPDNLPSGVSGSIGEDKSIAKYLLTLEDSAGTDNGYILINNAEQITAKTHVFDTASTGVRMTSVGKGDVTRICFWWDGDIAGILTDGAPLITFARTSMTKYTDDVFYKLILGAAYNGISNALTSGYFKNIVVSTNPPLRNCRVKSIGVLGDSYGVQCLDTTITYRLDAVLKYEVNRALMARGVGVVLKWGDHGLSGAAWDTVTGTDVAANLAAFLAGAYEYGLFTGPNNDVTDVSCTLTTTDTNMKSYIEQAMFADYPTNTIRSQMKKAFVETPGSLWQEDTHNTDVKNSRNATARANVLALESWWDTTYPNFAGDLIIIDLWSILGGDASPNWNYQGEWDALGNGVAVVTGNKNRHPSAQGWNKVARVLAARID